MSGFTDIEAFIKEHKPKLLQEKLRFETNLSQQTTSRSKTNDSQTAHDTDAGDLNSKNSKVILDDCLPISKIRPTTPTISDANEWPALEKDEGPVAATKASGNSSQKSSVIETFRAPKDGNGSGTSNVYRETDVLQDQREMSTISRFTSMSHPPCRRSQSEGVSSISSLGTEYEMRKRELFLARNKEYKEYLAKQKRLEQNSKMTRREYDLNRDEDDYSVSSTNAMATQTALGYRYDRNLEKDRSNSNNKKCSIAVQTEPLRSLTQNRTACRNRSLDLVSYGGGDSHDWDEETPAAERVITPRKQIPSVRIPKTLSKRKMIEQLRSTYYPSFGDCFESPEERKIRLAKEEARKREIYQMELSEQIREKRAEMEAIKRKEMEEELALARRLEAQIQNMQMERDLEILSQENRKEKMRKNSIRFNERKKQLQLEVEQEKEKLRQARKACPHNMQNSPSTSVVMQNRAKSPPIPALKNRQQPFSTNIDDESLFAKSHNKNAGSLAEQIRKLNGGQCEFFSAYKNYDMGSSVSDDYRTKVGSWDVAPGFRDDPDGNVRRSVSEESATATRSMSQESNCNDSVKRRGYSETSIHHAHRNDETDDNTECLTKVLSDEKFATNSILTQLGAIRRQLQMTQLELDERLSKS